MAFHQLGEKKTQTDEGYGSNYSAAYTETTQYQHPKGLTFTHVHKDGRDREDVYRYETVTIGDMEITYSYDWGNYFVVEYIKISSKDTEISYIERSHGAVDPLKFETRQREEGQKVLRDIAEDFGLSTKQLAEQFSDVFRMSLPCLALLE